MSGALARTHHLGKKINIVIYFTRHLFADRVEHFKKTRSAIHKVKSLRYFRWFGNQKLRGYDHRHEETGRGIEKTNTGLPADIRQMTKVPSD